MILQEIIEDVITISVPGAISLISIQENKIIITAKA